MNGFGDMLVGDGIASIEVGNGARDPSDAVICARGQSEVAHTSLEKSLRCAVERTVPIELSAAEHGIAAPRALAKFHAGTSFKDSAAEIGAGCSGSRGLERCEGYRAYFDMHVDPVKQRAGEPTDVALLCSAFRGTLREPASMTRVHGCDEHGACWETNGAVCTRDRDEAVLKRLAQAFECDTWELWQLIEEQHSVMRQTHFARSGNRSATDDCCGAC